MAYDVGFPGMGAGFTILEVPNSNLSSCFKRIPEVNSSVTLRK